MNARRQVVDEVPGRMVEHSLPAGFDDAFHLYFVRISRVIRRVVNDPARAEELAVDVFWRLWQQPQVQGEMVGGWLHRTAVRAGLDELRRQTRRAKFERLLRWKPTDAETPERVHAASQEIQRVRVVLAAMPQRQAELLLLRSDGLSYDELARSLQLRTASIGTFLVRAQEAFRKEYVKRYGKP